MKSLTNVPWSGAFTQNFSPDSTTVNHPREVTGTLYTKVLPTPVKSPTLLAWSHSLAEDLGISRPDASDQVALGILSGNALLPSMTPYSTRYGGYQFGHWAGQLGDGRAITLGAVSSAKISPESPMIEIQLKGAGVTPYSRHADGRAVLRSSLREYIASEALHHLGVPSTRALSLVLTGESIWRDMFYDGNPNQEPGAIVARAAPSFLRFGHFEILAFYQEHSLLKQLADYIIKLYYPILDPQDPNVYGELFAQIAQKTALMIAHWMRVGFVHGVMNTDNMSVLGLTIDYGPYSFLDAYDPDFTPNTTDLANRRYRYSQQPQIALWNLARLGEAFVSLVPNISSIQQGLERYRATFEATHQQFLAKKLGFAKFNARDHPKLFAELWSLMLVSEMDYTLFFTTMKRLPVTQILDAHTEDLRLNLLSEFFSKELEAITYLEAEPFAKLQRQWVSCLRQICQVYITDKESSQDHQLLNQERLNRMRQVNPEYVIRNYLAHLASEQAAKADLSLLTQIEHALECPYNANQTPSELLQKRPTWAKNAPGCSMLSCSS